MNAHFLKKFFVSTTWIGIDYINQVKTAIQETKKVALLFKQENQRDYALQAMARIKRMQEEVDEVEQAQADGVEL